MLIFVFEKSVIVISFSCRKWPNKKPKLKISHFGQCLFEKSFPHFCVFWPAFLVLAAPESWLELFLGHFQTFFLLLAIFIGLKSLHLGASPKNIGQLWGAISPQKLVKIHIIIYGTKFFNIPNSRLSLMSCKQKLSSTLVLKIRPLFSPRKQK